MSDRYHDEYKNINEKLYNEFVKCLKSKIILYDKNGNIDKISSKHECCQQNKDLLNVDISYKPHTDILEQYRLYYNYVKNCENLSIKLKNNGFVDFILETGEHSVYTISYIDENDKIKTVFFDTYGPEKYRQKSDFGQGYKSFLEKNRNKIEDLLSKVSDKPKDQCEFILLHTPTSQLDGDCRLLSHIVANTYREFFGNCTLEELREKFEYLITKLKNKKATRKVFNGSKISGSNNPIAPYVLAGEVLDRFINYIECIKNPNEINEKEKYGFYEIRTDGDVIVYKDGIRNYDKMLKDLNSFNQGKALQFNS